MSDTSSHGEPAPDDEPRTPAWLTAVGVALFVAVAVAWVALPSRSPSPSGDPVPTASPAPPTSPPSGDPHR